MVKGKKYYTKFYKKLYKANNKQLSNVYKESQEIEELKQNEEFLSLIRNDVNEFSSHESEYSLEDYLEKILIEASDVAYVMKIPFESNKNPFFPDDSEILVPL